MKYLAIFGGIVLVTAGISAALLFKAVRDLDEEELKTDYDFCDGSLCCICPGEKKCEKR